MQGEWSMLSKPVIGIPVDAMGVNGKPFHGVGEKYVNAVAHGSEAIPFLVPAFGEGVELDPLHALLEKPVLIGQGEIHGAGLRSRARPWQ